MTATKHACMAGREVFRKEVLLRWNLKFGLKGHVFRVLSMPNLAREGRGSFPRGP